MGICKADDGCDAVFVNWKAECLLYRDIHLVILSGKVQTLTPGSRCFIKE